MLTLRHDAWGWILTALAVLELVGAFGLLGAVTWWLTGAVVDDLARDSISKVQPSSDDQR